MNIKVGDKIAGFAVETIQGETVSVPDVVKRFTHLQFRRFAGCPICSTHTRAFSKAAKQIDAAGIREVIFFHSSNKELKKFQADLPFAAVADPQKTLYKKFGVETSIFASLHPRAMWSAIKGVCSGTIGLKAEGGPFGLPADILVDHTGTVVAVKYGSHAYDQWEVDELLKLAGNRQLANAPAIA